MNLSGGQAQKMALARALYCDTQILVLDEPAAYLDPIAEMELYERFSRLFRDKTCIFISHRLSSVKFCDKVIMMEQGRISGYGTHEELMEENSYYNTMWSAQSQPYRQKMRGENSGT